MYSRKMCLGRSAIVFVPSKCYAVTFFLWHCGFVAGTDTGRRLATAVTKVQVLMNAVFGFSWGKDPSFDIKGKDGKFIVTLL